MVNIFSEDTKFYNSPMYNSTYTGDEDTKTKVVSSPTSSTSMTGDEGEDTKFSNSTVFRSSMTGEEDENSFLESLAKDCESLVDTLFSPTDADSVQLKKELEATKREVGTLEKRLSEVTEKLLRAQEQHGQAMHHLEQKLTEKHLESMEAMRKQHNDTLSVLVNSWQQKPLSVNRAEETILVKEYKEKIDVIKKRHADEQEENTKVLSRLKKRNEEQEEEQKLRYEQRITELKKSYEQQVEELKVNNERQKDALKFNYETLSFDHERQIEEVKIHYEALNCNNHKQIEDLKLHYEKQIENLKIFNERLTDNVSNKPNTVTPISVFSVFSDLGIEDRLKEIDTLGPVLLRPCQRERLRASIFQTNQEMDPCEFVRLANEASKTDRIVLCRGKRATALFSYSSFVLGTKLEEKDTFNCIPLNQEYIAAWMTYLMECKGLKLSTVTSYAYTLRSYEVDKTQKPTNLTPKFLINHCKHLLRVYGYAPKRANPMMLNDLKLILAKHHGPFVHAEQVLYSNMRNISYLKLAWWTGQRPDSLTFAKWGDISIKIHSNQVLSMVFRIRKMKVVLKEPHKVYLNGTAKELCPILQLLRYMVRVRVFEMSESLSNEADMDKVVDMIISTPQIIRIKPECYHLYIFPSSTGDHLDFHKRWSTYGINKVISRFAEPTQMKFTSYSTRRGFISQWMVNALSRSGGYDKAFEMLVQFIGWNFDSTIARIYIGEMNSKRIDSVAMVTTEEDLDHENENEEELSSIEDPVEHDTSELNVKEIFDTIQSEGYSDESVSSNGKLILAYAYRRSCESIRSDLAMEKTVSLPSDLKSLLKESMESRYQHLKGAQRADKKHKIGSTFSNLAAKAEPSLEIQAKEYSYYYEHPKDRSRCRTAVIRQLWDKEQPTKEEQEVRANLYEIAKNFFNRDYFWKEIFAKSTDPSDLNIVLEYPPHLLRDLRRFYLNNKGKDIYREEQVNEPSGSGEAVDPSSTDLLNFAARRACGIPVVIRVAELLAKNTKDKIPLSMWERALRVAFLKLYFQEHEGIIQLLANKLIQKWDSFVIPDKITEAFVTQTFLFPVGLVVKRTVKNRYFSAEVVDQKGKVCLKEFPEPNSESVPNSVRTDSYNKLSRSSSFQTTWFSSFGILDAICSTPGAEKHIYPHGPFMNQQKEHFLPKLLLNCTVQQLQKVCIDRGWKSQGKKPVLLGIIQSEFMQVFKGAIEEDCSGWEIEFPDLVLIIEETKQRIRKTAKKSKSKSVDTVSNSSSSERMDKEQLVDSRIESREELAAEKPESKMVELSKKDTIKKKRKGKGIVDETDSEEESTPKRLRRV